MNSEELTQKYVALDERVTRHAEQIKTMFNQIGEAKAIAESVHKLATNVELLAHEQKSTSNKVDALSGDIEEIKGRPARRWENAVSTAIKIIVTAIITYALTRAGLQ